MIITRLLAYAGLFAFAVVPSSLFAKTKIIAGKEYDICRDLTQWLALPINRSAYETGLVHIDPKSHRYSQPKWVELSWLDITHHLHPIQLPDIKKSLENDKDFLIRSAELDIDNEMELSGDEKIVSWGSSRSAGTCKISAETYLSSGFHEPFNHFPETTQCNLVTEWNYDDDGKRVGSNLTYLISMAYKKDGTHFTVWETQVRKHANTPSETAMPTIKIVQLCDLARIDD